MLSHVQACVVLYTLTVREAEAKLPTLLETLLWTQARLWEPGHSLSE